MNERGLKILEQYDLKVSGTRRGRGAFLCDTDQGLKLVTEFRGSGNRLSFQNKVLKHLREQGYPLVDVIVENAEGNLVTADRDGTTYVVKDWFEGRECDTKNEEDILAAIRNLARLHKLLSMPEEMSEQTYSGLSLKAEYERRNREIKKVQKFMRTRQRKNEFESLYLNCFEDFAQQAREAAKQLEQSSYEQMHSSSLEQGVLCHGDYNQHQILNTRNGIATTNFNKCRYDIQIGDLYHFMRKILEKQNWSPRLGLAMLEEYDQVISLMREHKEYLKLRFIYPEKFWKLANHYYNHNKAWIPGKNVEKLTLLIDQNQKRDTFLKILDL